MNNSQSLTVKQLLKALQALEKRITKSRQKDLKNLEQQIFEDRTEFHTTMVQPQFDQLNTRFDTFERENKTDHSHIKNQIKDLIAEHSNTVSQKEFKELQAKVLSHHPAN